MITFVKFSNMHLTQQNRQFPSLLWSDKTHKPDQTLFHTSGWPPRTVLPAYRSHKTRCSSQQVQKTFVRARGKGCGRRGEVTAEALKGCVGHGLRSKPQPAARGLLETWNSQHGGLPLLLGAFQPLEKGGIQV